MTTQQKKDGAAWSEMTGSQMVFTMRAMCNYGGNFAGAIGYAFQCADANNMHRLAAAFPDLIERYGPGSEPYKKEAGEQQ